MAKKAAALLMIPVAYGNVTVGDETISIGLVVERKILALGVADKQLVGKRLIGKITCVFGNSNPEQPTLTDETTQEVEDSFDVNGIHVTKKKLRFGISFARTNIDMTTIADFAKRSGQFIVNAIEELPEAPRGRPKKESEDDDDADE